MNIYYQNEMKLAPSYCDYTGHLSVADAVALFMDAATAHADELGVGLRDFAPKQLFWVVAKTRIHFDARPMMGDTVTVKTWPLQPHGVRCLRYYTLEQDGAAVVSGKSEWAILNHETGKLQLADGVFSEEFPQSEDALLTEPFVRYQPTACREIIGEYTVRSTDIDTGRHMNNVAYLRAFFSLLTTAQWQELAVRDLEVIYKNQCYEGEKLTFKRGTVDGKLIVQAVREDGKIALQMAIS